MKNSVVQTLFILLLFLQLPNLIWGQYTLAFECPDCSMEVSIQPELAVLCEATLILEANVQNIPSSTTPEYMWSNGETTTSIEINTTGTYSVTVTAGLSCSTEAEISVVDKANSTDLDKYFLENGFYKYTISDDPVFRNPKENGTRSRSNGTLDMQKILDRFMEENSCIESSTNNFVSTCFNPSELDQINEDFNKQETGFWIHQTEDAVYIKSRSPNKEATNDPLSDEEKQHIEDKLAILDEFEVPESFDSREEFEAYYLLQITSIPIPEKITTNDKPNLSLPLVANPPDGNNSNSIAWFIDKIKEEETKIEESGGDCRNTKEMITRLRKIFYGAKGWDDNLIKNVENIQSPYGVPLESERGRVTVNSCYGDFDLIDKETYPCEMKIISINGDITCNEKPEVYDNNNQEVILSEGRFNGIFIDLGHVLAGLDAINNLHEVSAFQTNIGIDENVDAVTWVGDLGSSVADAFIAYFASGSNLNDEQVQNAIAPGSTPQDMIGNIDAYVIGNSGVYNIGATSEGPKVSEILESYYLNMTVPDHFVGRIDLQDYRFSNFTSQLGLIWDESSMTFTEESKKAFIDKYLDQIADASALFIGASTLTADSFGDSISQALTTLDLNRKEEFPRIILEIFLDALEKEINKEP